MIAYLVGIPAIMLGSVLLVGSILALLEPGRDRHDHAHAAIERGTLV